MSLEEILALGPEFAEFADDIKAALGYAVEYSGELTEANEQQADSLRDLINIANEFAGAIYEAYSTAHNATYESLMGQVSLTREFGDVTSITFEQMMANAQSYYDAMKSHNQNLQAALELGLDPAVAERFFSTLTPDTAGMVAAIVEAGGEGIGELNDMWLSQMPDVAGELAGTFASVNSEFISEVEAMMEAAGATAEEGAAEMVSLIVGAIIENGGMISDETISVLTDGLVSAREATAGESEAVGAALTGGMAAGVHSNASALNNAITSVVRTAIARARVAAEINSPSRLSERLLGEPIGEGVGVGILNKIQDTREAMAQLVSSDNYQEAQRMARSEEYQQIVAVHPALMAATQPGMQTASVTTIVPSVDRSAIAPIFNINITVEGGIGGDIRQQVNEAGESLKEQLDDWWREKQEDIERRKYV